MLDRFSPQLRRAMVLAHSAARAAGAERIGVVHLLCGLVGSDADLSRKLAATGLTAAAIEAHLGPRVAVPEPMGRDEERLLREQLRRQGLSLSRADEFVMRIQRQRAVGPVAFEPTVHRLLKDAATGRDEVTPAAVLATLLASPPTEVAEALEAAGTSVAAARAALAGR